MRNKLYAIITLIFVLSCGKEDEVVSEDKSSNEEIIKIRNSRPIILDQEFVVEENALIGTSIGFILANDTDGDNIIYLVPSIEGFKVNKDTGELRITKGNGFLDFETNDKFIFDYTISDGKLETTATITLIITDVEDGPLTNFEKEIVESFMLQIQFYSNEFTLFKRTENVNLFIDGSINTTLISSIVDNSIDEYNAMFSDGFQITIVEEPVEANVHLYLGTIEELNLLWPDFYEVAIEYPGLGGIAGWDRVWIADYAQNVRTVKHELGHIVGLGHAPDSQCNSSDGSTNSIMCGGVDSAGLDFTDVDRAVISYYFHPDMPNELSQDMVEDRLIQIILSER